MRYIASVIAKNTNNTEKDVYNLLKDQNYLNELINTYWFLDKSILNKNIYYSLEGYLYPDKYNFKDKDVTVKDIFKVMLDEEEKKLAPYKDEIIKSKYSYHEILTLASIIELEAGAADRAKVMKEHKHFQMNEEEYVSKKEIGRALEEIDKGLITIKNN